MGQNIQSFIRICDLFLRLKRPTFLVVFDVIARTRLTGPFNTYNTSNLLKVNKKTPYLMKTTKICLINLNCLILFFRILVGCNFNGPIPPTIGNLERLRYL